MSKMLKHAKWICAKEGKIMKTVVDAKIQWVNSEYGQRFAVPSEAKYCPIIIFDNQPNDGFAWGAVILFKKRDSDGSCLTELTYLSESAPFERLTPGNTFTLFEGNKKVAHGIVLNESAAE